MSNPQPGANIAPDDENPPPLAPPSRRQRWTRRALIALAALVYEIIWVTTAFDKVNPTDLDVFFFPATRIALAGHPLDIYQLRVGLIYPNANGPLGIAPVLLAAWLADMRGWLGDVVLRRALVFAITAPFPLLAGWEAARIVERFGGRLRGLARALPYLPMVLAPELWLSALYYGHIEQIIAVWLTLASLRLLIERHAIASGALLGLALLARSDVALIILPVVLLLLLRRQVKTALWFTVGMIVAFMAGIVPFLIADTRDTLFSLVAFRSALPVGGGNIWSLSNANAFLLFGQRYDAMLAIGVATLLTVAVLAVRRDLTLTSPDLVRIAGADHPLLCATHQDTLALLLSGGGALRYRLGAGALRRAHTRARQVVAHAHCRDIARMASPSGHPHLRAGRRIWPGGDQLCGLASPMGPDPRAAQPHRRDIDVRRAARRATHSSVARASPRSRATGYTTGDGAQRIR